MEKSDLTLTESQWEDVNLDVPEFEEDGKVGNLKDVTAQLESTLGSLSATCNEVDNDKAELKSEDTIENQATIAETVEDLKHNDHAWLCLEQDETGNMMLSVLKDQDSNGVGEEEEEEFEDWEVVNCSQEIFLLEDELKARALDKVDRAQSIALGVSGVSAVAMSGLSTSILGTMVLLAATDLLKLGYKGVEETSKNKKEMIQKVVCKSCVLGAISCGTGAVVGSAIVSASKVYIYVPAVTEALITGAVCSVGGELIDRKAADEDEVKLRKEKNMLVAALWGAVSSGAGGILKPLSSSSLVQYYLEQGTEIMGTYLK